MRSSTFPPPPLFIPVIPCDSTAKLSYGYKFTVVITSYNKGKWLKEAINSVLSQTLQDVQLIVVDDCSDDPHTIKVLKQTSKDVHLIRLDKNREPSAARNEGIKNADSEYICCLDGDDYLEPTYLEKARNVFENYKDVGIVTSFVKSFGKFTSRWRMQPDDMGLVSMLSANNASSDEKHPLRWVCMMKT